MYTHEMESHETHGLEENHHWTQTLASALSRAVDANSYTRTHSQIVSQLSALIAADLEVDADRAAWIRLAGLLHDVGKIGIPDAILNKPARLTAAEHQQMQAHTLLGCEIINAAGLPAEALWVRHHHERYDGAGYPDGLSKELFPLEARIILVADAFDAMTSDRPYRNAPGPDFALANCAATRAPGSTPASWMRYAASSHAQQARRPSRPEAVGYPGVAS